MPIPQPKKNEKQNDYIGRCMHKIGKEKMPQKQKVAICLNTYNNPKEKAKAGTEIDFSDKIKNVENKSSLNSIQDKNHNGCEKIEIKEENKNTIFYVEWDSEAYQKTYRGQKRSELKNSDFLFPDTRSFPIVSPQDVRDAISNYGRMSDKMTYDTFIKKLYQKAKSKGPEFVAAIPESTKKEHNLS